TIEHGGRAMQFYYRRSYRGPLKAVIHDWAGTVVDYGSCAPAGVFVEGFKRRGVEGALSQARRPVGSPKRDHTRALPRMEPVARQWQARYDRLPEESDVEAMYADFIPLQIGCLADYSALIPGAAEVLAELRERGFKLGSSTGYNAEMMAIVLDEAARQG